MTRERLKELLPIIQEYAEGKTVQYFSERGCWVDFKDPSFLGDVKKYHIKPEPKYRPFKTQEECWNEMHKHPDFGWIIAKDNKSMYHIYVVGISYILIEDRYIGFPETFANYEFTDGTPFGIKEE